MENDLRITVVSYNLHGLNQGYDYLESLCNEYDIVFTQEHWLAPFDLDRLNNISENVTVYASSAMTQVISEDCLKGRPFGGLAIFVRNNLVANVRLVKAASRYIIIQIGEITMINVYLPSVSTVGRDEEFIDSLSCIMNDLNDIECGRIIFGGDMNIDFLNTNNLNHILIDFAKDLDLKFVDDKLPVNCGSTFRVDTTGATSTIDHFAVSSVLYSNIQEVKIIDSGINLSDHCPLVLDLCIPLVRQSTLKQKAKGGGQHLSFRWDHGDVCLYYFSSYEHLSHINVPTYLLDEAVSHSFSKLDVLSNVNHFYTSIVRALFDASCIAIPRKKCNFYKYWWDEELVLLKERAVQSFKLWSALGKPRSGHAFDSMRMDKRRYKIAIKTKRSSAANQFSDSLNDALLMKDMDAFWNSWKSKFGKQQPSTVVDGCCDDKGIADKFAALFSSIYVPNSAERHDHLCANFHDRFSHYSVNNVAQIDVELVDKCISQLKKGKAAGIDCLTAEHICLAHPILVVHLTLLFNILLKYNLVPDGFGQGIIIPLLKSADCDRTDSSNYRGITLSPIISKLFEMVLMTIYKNQLASSSLQFGFKQQSSCSHALFTVRTVIEHYVKNGSTVNICALDISKAFDKVDHYALFQLLMDRGLPKNFIGTLMNWFLKSIVCVRWGCVLSFWFTIHAGVRQGGCLSPILFAIYMDVLITRLKCSRFGCHLCGEYFGCVVYADDILLLAHSLKAMRCMLKICEKFAVDLDVKFNSNKSVAMRIGPRYNAVCKPLSLCGCELQYVDNVKYLGIFLIADKKFKCSVDHLKMKFFKAFNCLYSRTKAANSEHVIVQLMKSYCLPFILYASEAIALSATNIRVLDNCINRAMYKIFGVRDAASMFLLRNSLGLPDLSCVIDGRVSNFMDKLIDNSDFTVVLQVFVYNVC